MPSRAWNFKTGKTDIIHTKHNFTEILVKKQIFKKIN